MRKKNLNYLANDFVKAKIKKNTLVTFMFFFIALGAISLGAIRDYSTWFGLVALLFFSLGFYIEKQSNKYRVILGNIHHELSLANFIYFNCEEGEFKRLKYSHERHYRNNY